MFAGAPTGSDSVKVPVHTSTHRCLRKQSIRIPVETIKHSQLASRIQFPHCSRKKKSADIIRENGLLKEPTKAILERALQAEMIDHLG